MERKLRYASFAKSIADELCIRTAAGAAVLTVAYGEQLAVARAIASAIGSTPRSLTLEDIESLAGTPVVAGIPPGPAMRRLNDLRDRIRDRGVRLILVLSSEEEALFQSAAPDLNSALLFYRRVPFESDGGFKLDDAKSALFQYYHDRYGRLDLRGFLRSSRDDVSWEISSVYQNLRARWVRFPRNSGGKADTSNHSVSGARAQDRAGVLGNEHGLTGEEVKRDARDRARMTVYRLGIDLLESLSDLSATSEPLIILGHPGSGKSFFLRWCALSATQSARFLGVDHPLPVLIPLAAFVAAPGPRELVTYARDLMLSIGPAPGHLLDEVIGAGRVLFLLDGLDEVGTELGRSVCREAIESLSKTAPGNRIIVTCRVAGWAEDPFPGGIAVLQPFTNREVRHFLSSWCSLYAVATSGPAKKEAGQQEGNRLADEVLSRPSLRDLARTPLLLTVLAIVHRAGTKLPDQRIELYHHALTVLVERWNEVRSLTGHGVSQPIRAADAQRLLGPVALQMVTRGESAIVSEEALKGHLESALEKGHLRSLGSAVEAIRLFRQSIGLLVEVRPGWFGFLHLSFVEALAARELVRSGRLEALCADPILAYQQQWREVLLLSAGELGVVRADDDRLTGMIKTLVTSANRRRGRPSASVPSLLGGLVADDPALSKEATDALVSELVPKWWFARRYHDRTRPFVLVEAAELIARVGEGRLAPRLRSEFQSNQDELIRFREWLLAFIGRYFHRYSAEPLRWLAEIADVVIGERHGIVRTLPIGPHRAIAEQLVKQSVATQSSIRADVFDWALRLGLRKIEVLQRTSLAEPVDLPSLRDLRDRQDSFAIPVSLPKKEPFSVNVLWGPPTWGPRNPS